MDWAWAAAQPTSSGPAAQVRQLASLTSTRAWLQACVAELRREHTQAGHRHRDLVHPLVTVIRRTCSPDSAPRQARTRSERATALAAMIQEPATTPATSQSNSYSADYSTQSPVLLSAKPGLWYPYMQGSVKSHLSASVRRRGRRLLECLSSSFNDMLAPVCAVDAPPGACTAPHHDLYLCLYRSRGKGRHLSPKSASPRDAPRTAVQGLGRV